MTWHDLTWLICASGATATRWYCYSSLHLYFTSLFFLSFFQHFYFLLPSTPSVQDRPEKCWHCVKNVSCLFSGLLLALWCDFLWCEGKRFYTHNIYICALVFSHLRAHCSSAKNLVEFEVFLCCRIHLKCCLSAGL